MTIGPWFGWLLRKARFAVFLALTLGTGCAAAPPSALRDDLAAPPFVTAKAWAITDGKTGRFLWGLNADQPLKAASTTKMMCSYVILQLAAKDPKVLDEVVTFSKLADGTPGSTADISEGEQITVRDGLFALMLPSGNDMGNAFAEHFDARFKPPEKNSRANLSSTNLATRRNFIAEMNRSARKLGMKNTVYRSAFGDGGTDGDRTTSVRDLLILAHAGLNIPRFREVVGTPRYECRVRQSDGAYRNAMWENTNQLLGLPGYDGIKTGTTTTAGNCLVSSCHCGDDHLLVAVLGSESDRGRYVDTQNLFRWAWLKRGHK